MGIGGGGGDGAIWCRNFLEDPCWLLVGCDLLHALCDCLHKRVLAYSL